MRLLNEDQHQLILKNINLDNDQKCEQSLVEITQVENNEDNNNSLISMSNTNGSFELTDVENTSQDHNGLENEAIGPLKNKNIVLKSQLQNDKAYRKSLTPCPFLMRRGWCVKGDRCDFQHPTPRRNYHKHNVPCPFLRKNGSCLKGNNCDFSHGVFPYPNKRSASGPVGESHPYNPFLVPHQGPSELIPRRTMQSKPYYPQGSIYVHPQPWPRPLMEVPVYPPFPYRI